MRRRKHLNEDLQIMHRVYDDLMQAYKEADTQNERLKRQVEGVWARWTALNNHVRELELQQKNLERYLQDKPPYAVKIERDPFMGRRAIQRMESAEMLGLDSGDNLEVGWDHLSHAFVFRVSTTTGPVGLLTILDRVTYTFQHMRAKAAEEFRADL